jgi:CheY-like chemotaxis protein
MARVLVVEDDPVSLRVFTTCLGLDHHEVQTASDIPGGVDLLRREVVDLILTDLFAEVFSPDVFAELVPFTQVAPACPLVVATAHAQAAACDPSAHGLEAIIVKPFAPHDLRALVARVLATHADLASRGLPPGAPDRC